MPTRSKPHIKGHCQDCEFLEQQFVREEIAGQKIEVTDIFCGLFDVFVPLDGYCHAWERRR